ncbi:uncharacterized protein LOC133905336 [Phragmites australis]|uniref:uncharacterized protein LOC133905336 n=1 Tax=Phragmites australis TaxID=29695 RepID=UPI002D785D7B|nr:uncharacterized protein LOC133905336 [Phragmites australis]
MDGDDSMGWVTVALTYFALALMYGCLLAMAAAEAAACFRRWRGRRDNLLAAERLLESVDDVPYQQLPDDDADEGGSSSCVVCLAEYERGERCFVLPGCAHTFHRGCIAPWLRQGKNTCPICRETLAAPAQQCINTAENMV